MGWVVVAELRRVFGDCRKVFFKAFLVMFRLFDDSNLPIAMEAEIKAEIPVYCQESLTLEVHWIVPFFLAEVVEFNGFIPVELVFFAMNFFLANGHLVQ